MTLAIFGTAGTTFLHQGPVLSNFKSFDKNSFLEHVDVGKSQSIVGLT